MLHWCESEPESLQQCSVRNKRGGVFVYFSNDNKIRQKKCSRFPSNGGCYRVAGQDEHDARADHAVASQDQGGRLLEKLSVRD